MSKARLKRIEGKLNANTVKPGVFILQAAEEGGFLLLGDGPKRFETYEGAVSYFDSLAEVNPGMVLIIDWI